MDNSNTYKLSDTAIAQVAKLLQMAMLTGTDVVDNLRTLELIERDGILDPTVEFMHKMENNVESMLEELSEAGVLPETIATDG